LSGKEQPHVLYIGTASYDAASSQDIQTSAFLAAGCTVESLPVAVRAPAYQDMQLAFSKADIVLVSGGNTLFAVERWKALGNVTLTLAKPHPQRSTLSHSPNPHPQPSTLDPRPSTLTLTPHPHPSTLTLTPHPLSLTLTRQA
jgi:hypothetical protein